MKNLLYWQNPSTLNQIQESLRTHQVLVTSTDTTLGLLAELHGQAFEALNSIKGGRQNKPYLVLIGSPESLDLFIDPVCLSSPVSNLLQHFWPGPLTVIFKAKSGLPSFLVSGDGTIALRCPHHQGLLGLLKHFDGLFSTSANRSGEPVPQYLSDVDPLVLSMIEYSVVDDAELHYSSKPSTMIDVSNVGKFAIVREGAITRQEIEIFLKR